MNADDFEKYGTEMVKYIADYMRTLPERRVTSDVEPGYMRGLLPEHAPMKGENFREIMKDVERIIMPGLTQWQHPQFHAYFPTGNSYPSILGDMLSDAISGVCFSWAANPACTELEVVVLDWIGKLINLPSAFLHEGGRGGGVIQANSCVEKAGMIGLVKMRQLEVDENYALRGYTLENAIEEDRRMGFIPFYVCATLGTTGCCSHDNIQELGEICAKEHIWFHVDAAYAGNALICPEYQYLLKGVENVSSINISSNKWMLVNLDCSLMWVRDRKALTSALTVDPVYLKHEHDDKELDFRNWGIPLGRRFRALKLWFVLRIYGVEGLQNYIRSHVKLAKLFEENVCKNDLFEVVGKVTMGLVCFRLKGPNCLTQRLLKDVNDSRKLHMIPALINEKYVIRFAVCCETATDDDIKFAWQEIANAAEDLMSLKSETETTKIVEKFHSS